MSLILSSDAPSKLIAVVVEPNGEVVRIWDMRSPDIELPSGALPPDYRDAYMALLPPRPADRDPIEIDKDRPALIVLADGQPIGAVGIYYAALQGRPKSEVCRIMGITSTGRVPRTAVLIVAAAAQFVRAHPVFYHFVAPIAPYFVMECIFYALGAVRITGEELLKLGDPMADPDAPDEETPALSTSVDIHWAPIPYQRSDIIRNNDYAALDEFVKANRHE
jgi:hypothetical protein